MDRHVRVVRSGVIFAQQGPRPSSAAGADEENLMREEGDQDQDQVQRAVQVQPRKPRGLCSAGVSKMLKNP